MWPEPSEQGTGGSNKVQTRKERGMKIDPDFLFNAKGKDLKVRGQKSHNHSFLKKASGQLFKTDKMDAANPLQTKSRFF